MQKENVTFCYFVFFYFMFATSCWMKFNTVLHLYADFYILNTYWQEMLL